MNANSASSNRQSTMPNSSAATANTESVWLSGSTRLTVPSPGPRPNQPPREEASRATSMLNVFAEVREGKIAPRQPDRRGAAKADDPDPAHAGHEEQRAPDERDQHRLAEVR